LYAKAKLQRQKQCLYTKSENTRKNTRGMEVQFIVLLNIEMEPTDCRLDARAALVPCIFYNIHL
jgi:hypothetical protein